MAVSLGVLTADVRRRLSDFSETFWTESEIEGYVQQGYKALCRSTRAIWDVRYAENLPRGMSYTAVFEAALVDFDYGRANFTYEWERRLFDPEHDAEGPAAHTSPAEVADDGSDLPALAALPRTVSEIDRPLWDQRAIDVLSPKQVEGADSRYEHTRGEVFAIVATQQGPRTIRKVRVPAGVADTYTVEGSWGILRNPPDYDGDVVEEGSSDAWGASWGSAWGSSWGVSTTAGIWGHPRRLPSHHPMGSEQFGLPRRLYRDGKNVRIEHWREGRQVTEADDVFEVPDRATAYLRDYALSQCYAKHGPAQDSKLAAHYQARYARGVARLQRRVTAQQRGRVGQLGGAMPLSRSGPPRPRLPWQFGTIVR